MYALGFAMVVLVSGIACIICYSIGHDAGLGKPRPQSCFEAGAVYAPLSSTTLATPRKDLRGYDEQHLALLRSADGSVIYAELEEQLPDGKKVMVTPCVGGKIRFHGFNPEKKEPRIDVVA